MITIYKKNTTTTADLQKKMKNKTQTAEMNVYNSADGMLTSTWGPMMWLILHMISFNYPVEPTQQQKKWYKLFVTSLTWTLPCGACRRNLRKNLRAFPLLARHLKTRATFSRYIYDLHNKVNEMLKKRVPSTLTYERVRDFYESFRARCTTTTTRKKQQVQTTTRKKHSATTVGASNIAKHEVGCVRQKHVSKLKPYVNISFTSSKPRHAVSIDKRCKFIYLPHHQMKR